MYGSEPKRAMIVSNVKQRKLPMKEGKISISLSLKGCRNCQRLNNEVITMRRQIVRLNEELQLQKIKNKEMDILCEEISRTKNRLIQRMQEKRQDIKLTKGRNRASVVKFVSQNSFVQSKKFMGIV